MGDGGAFEMGGGLSIGLFLISMRFSVFSVPLLVELYETLD